MVNFLGDNVSGCKSFRVQKFLGENVSGENVSGENVSGENVSGENVSLYQFVDKKDIEENQIWN